MRLSKEERDLGMDRHIPRRDFLNGMAVGLVGACALMQGRQAFTQSSGQRGDTDYPPARTGLRGHYPEAIEYFDPIAEGTYAQYPAIDVDTRQTYDLVIVGAGISGLAAAYFWRKALGRSSRILILDNHDDFGGHAKRNEFEYERRTFIGYGGTMSISTPYPYSYVSKALISDLGIEVERNHEFLDRQLFEKYGLGPGMFFDREHFGEDRLVKGNGRIPWNEFF